MVYEMALRRETEEMKRAAELHPDYDCERLREFTNEKCQLVMIFADRLKRQKEECKDRDFV